MPSSPEIMPACESGLVSSKVLRFPILKNQTFLSAEARAIDPSYTLGTDDHWPDQVLNRILATLDGYDFGRVSQTECLEMIIYTTSRRIDARKLATSAIETYGSLAKVFTRPGKELREILGFDNATTSMLAIVKCSMKYILEPCLISRQEIGSYAHLMAYLAVDLREVEHEILRVLYLDTKSKIIRDEQMGCGTVDAVPIYPKEIAKRALAYCASSVILAHNHLSDDPTPSQADIEATIKTQGVLANLDIVLHDHIIIARGRSFSMSQKGLIKTGQPIT